MSDDVAIESIPGVLRIMPPVHRDARGSFVKLFSITWLPQFRPAEDNYVRRVAGALVGMHYHLAQSDLWRVTVGACYVVLVDLRVRSPAHKKAAYLRLDADDFECLYIPPGVAHGFLALEEMALSYLQDRPYSVADEYGFRWNDEELALRWPCEAPILSPRDQANPPVADVPEIDLPVEP